MIAADIPQIVIFPQKELTVFNRLNPCFTFFYIPTNDLIRDGWRDGESLVSIARSSALPQFPADFFQGFGSVVVKTRRIRITVSSRGVSVSKCC